MDGPNWEKRVCAVLFLCATAAISLPAQTFTTLHSFDSADGVYPGAVVQAANGSLYGTTDGGGGAGYGTVFKITPSGALTTLHSFDYTDGSGAGTPVQGTDGNFYGTATFGGANSCIQGFGCGTVFKITPSGALTTLYSFCLQSGCSDGDLPNGLIQATDGNFYGTTGEGGTTNHPYCPYGCGTVFKVAPTGTLTTLHNFNSADGYSPVGALVQDANGDFYGVTGGGYGTIFKITPSGTLTTLLSFNNTDGASPSAGLVLASDGTFYGTTYGGGANTSCRFGCGTVFNVTPSGTLRTLYNFCSQSGCTDGQNPIAGLVQANDGNLYGTTYYGGANFGCAGASGCGTVFKITPTGTLTTLYSFCSQGGRYCPDGSAPVGALAQDTNGKFYGATPGGGVDGDGTLFSLDVGLGPFVETQPTSGKVGAPVGILGTNLRHATSVSFNGAAAVFKVVSSSLITTTVPAGATTGTVQVLTSSGARSSNVPFWVRP